MGKCPCCDDQCCGPSRGAPPTFSPNLSSDDDRFQVASMGEKSVMEPISWGMLCERTGPST